MYKRVPEVVTFILILKDQKGPIMGAKRNPRQRDWLVQKLFKWPGGKWV